MKHSLAQFLPRRTHDNDQSSAKRPRLSSSAGTNNESTTDDAVGVGPRDQSAASPAPLVVRTVSQINCIPHDPSNDADVNNQNPVNQQHLLVAHLVLDANATTDEPPRSGDEPEPLLSVDPVASSSNADNTVVADRPDVKIKQECDTKIGIKIEIKEEVVAPTPAADNVQPAVAPPLPAIVPPRVSCNFGIKCYLRDPVHRNAMAHPGDPDYRRPYFPPAAPNTPQCPFGARCYRRNPQHFVQLQHPTADTYSTDANAPPVPTAVAPQRQPSIRTNSRQHNRATNNRANRDNQTIIDDGSNNNNNAGAGPISRLLYSLFSAIETDDEDSSYEYNNTSSSASEDGN